MTATLEPDALVSDAQAKRNVMVLVAAQAILGAQMPMLFVVGGLAGGMLAWHVCFATLPIALIVFGSMTTAPWLSPFMQRNGRKAGFAAKRKDDRPVIVVRVVKSSGRNACALAFVMASLMERS